MFEGLNKNVADKEIFSFELLAHDEWFLQKLTSICSTFEVEYGEKSRVWNTLESWTFPSTN